MQYSPGIGAPPVIWETLGAGLWDFMLIPSARLLAAHVAYCQQEQGKHGAFSRGPTPSVKIDWMVNVQL